MKATKLLINRIIMSRKVIFKENDISLFLRFQIILKNVFLYNTQTINKMT